MMNTRQVNELRSAAAHRMVAAAQAAAAGDGVGIAVVCVDRGGHIIVADRMDGAATCAVPLALSKAETAAATLAPTAVWFESTQPGQPNWGMNMPFGGRYNVMPGGLPIELGGEVVGAIGVSGGEAVQDASYAAAALAALG